MVFHFGLLFSLITNPSYYIKGIVSVLDTKINYRNLKSTHIIFVDLSTNKIAGIHTLFEPS